MDITTIRIQKILGFRNMQEKLENYFFEENVDIL